MYAFLFGYGTFFTRQDWIVYETGRHYTGHVSVDRRKLCHNYCRMVLIVISKMKKEKHVCSWQKVLKLGFFLEVNCIVSLVQHANFNYMYIHCVPKKLDYILCNNCCLSRCFQQSNMLQNVVYSQNNMLLTAKLVIFCSVISQGKVVALDRWGGKRNHLSMMHRLTTNYAKNYCNRTLIVKVIV